MPVHLVVTIQTKPGMGQRQREAFHNVVAEVRAEQGCERYDLFAVAGDPDRFVILEQWASRADLDAHGVAPHMVGAGRLNAEFRAVPAHVVELEAL